MGKDRNSNDKRDTAEQRLIDSCASNNRSFVEKLLENHRIQRSDADQRSLKRIVGKLRTYSDNDPDFERAIEEFAFAEAENVCPLEADACNDSD